MSVSDYGPRRYPDYNISEWCSKYTKYPKISSRISAEAFFSNSPSRIRIVEFLKYQHSYCRVERRGAGASRPRGAGARGISYPSWKKTHASRALFNWNLRRAMHGIKFSEMYRSNATRIRHFRLVLNLLSYQGSLNPSNLPALSSPTLQYSTLDRRALSWTEFKFSARFSGGGEGLA